MIDWKRFKNEVTMVGSCLTQADIAEEEEKRDKKLTFGIIIDISEAHRYDDSNQYVTKIKLIDPTFNFRSFIKNKQIKFHKFITVNIYSQFLTRCPKIKNVGDILRLRRFNVSLAAQSVRCERSRRTDRVHEQLLELVDLPRHQGK